MTRVRRSAATTFRSFSHRNFRVYFGGQVVSQTGTWLQLIAETLLVLRLRNSGVALGALVVFQYLPILLLGPWAGVLCDRFDRRRILMVTQSVMMSLAFLLGALTLTATVTLAAVFGVAAIGGIATAFDNPARRVIISDLVPESDLANAIGLNSMLMTTARLVGPALAALLITTVGIGWCFVANGVSFVAVLWALGRLDLVAGVTRSSERTATQLVEGIRYVWSDRPLRMAMSLMAVVATLAFNWQVVLPLFAERTLGGDETTYTMLTSILGVGSLVGALVVAHRQRVTVEFLAGAAVCFGIASAALAVAPSTAASVIPAIAAGMTGIVFLSSCASFVQIHSREELRGRVVALYSMIFLGSTPIGGPIAGWVSQGLGPRYGLMLGAVPTLLAGVLVALNLRAGARQVALGH